MSAADLAVTIDPSGTITNDGIPNHAGLIRGIQIPFICIAAFAVVLRFYARISVKRKIAIDDGLIILGWSAALARTVTACIGTEVGWGPRSGPKLAIQVPFYRHIFERRLFYILSVTFTRCSVLLYYLRIFPCGLGLLRKFSVFMLVITLAQSIQLSTVLGIYCSTIHHLYDGDFRNFHSKHCFNAPAFSYSSAIGDAVIDCVIFLLPIPYVWGLKQLQIRQRIGLCVVFGLGLIACVIALLQIPFLLMEYRFNKNGNSFFGGIVSTLIAVELSVAIIAASLPDIRGLVARSYPQFMKAFEHHLSFHHRNTLQSRRSPRGQCPDMNINNGDLEHGITPPATGEISTARIKNTLARPDWLRSTIPRSLLSTLPGVSRVDTVDAEEEKGKEKGKSSRHICETSSATCLETSSLGSADERITISVVSGQEKGLDIGKSGNGG